MRMRVVTAALTAALLAATASPAAAGTPGSPNIPYITHESTEYGNYTTCAEITPSGEYPEGGPFSTTVFLYSHQQGRLGSYPHGANIYVSGTVRRGLRAVEVLTVEQKPAGAANWIPSGTVRTDLDGRFTYTAKAHITSRFRFTIAASDLFAGCSGEVLGPPVQAGVHGWTTYQTAVRGRKVTFVLAVDPAPRKVALQWHDYPGGPGWRTLHVTTADRNGRATVSFTPKKAGRYRLQIALSGDTRALSGHSDPKFLTVK